MCGVAGGPETALADLRPLAAFALRDTGRNGGVGGGLDVGFDKPITLSVTVKAVLVRPRDGRESTHGQRVDPAVAADVRDGAQIQCELILVLLATSGSLAQFPWNSRWRSAPSHGC